MFQSCGRTATQAKPGSLRRGGVCSSSLPLLTSVRSRVRASAFSPRSLATRVASGFSTEAGTAIERRARQVEVGTWLLQNVRQLEACFAQHAFEVGESAEDAERPGRRFRRRWRACADRDTFDADSDALGADVHAGDAPRVNQRGANQVGGSTAALEPVAIIIPSRNRYVLLQVMLVLVGFAAGECAALLAKRGFTRTGECLL